MQIDVFQAFEPYSLTHYTGDILSDVLPSSIT